MIEELAVGAQFNLPYIHVVVNNAYLGLIRQAQRGFDMDYCVQLGVRQHQRARDQGGYGVDHVAVAEGLGCKAIRVHRQEEIDPAIQQAEKWMAEYKVPVVIEIMLERDHQHRDGHRDRQSQSSSRSWPESLADAPTAVARDARLEPATSRDTTMPKFAANLTMLYNELGFLERFDAAAAAGFRGVEFLFPMRFPRPRSRNALSRNRLSLVLHNLPAGNWEAGERGIACHPEPRRRIPGRRGQGASNTPRRSACRN